MPLLAYDIPYSDFASLVPSFGRLWLWYSASLQEDLTAMLDLDLAQFAESCRAALAAATYMSSRLLAWPCGKRRMQVRG